MSLLDELKEKKPQGLLYHYTNQNGLLGILRDRNIWATNISYLNDKSELIHAVSLLSDRFKFKIANRLIKTSEPPLLVETLEEVFTIPGVSQIYVSSFSEEGDLLSQWRAYGKNGNGFAIGFDYDLLLELISKNKVYKNKYYNLLPCVYEENKQKDKIDILIDSELSAFDELIEQYRQKGKAEDIKLDTYKENVHKLLIDFFKIAPIIKNKSFAEEKEWRLISPFDFGAKGMKIDCREGEYTIIPYIKFRLDTITESSAIKKIIVSPTNFEIESRNAVKLLLSSLGYKDVEVSISKIPLRT